MKIQVEVLRVIQELDLDTMQTRCAIVIDVLGVVRELEVTEDEMDALVSGATKARRVGGAATQASMSGEVAFEETREPLSGPPSQGASREPVVEKQFSIMSDELGDPIMEEATERDPGLGGIFDMDREDPEEKKLREENKKKIVPRRTVPQDDAGNPQVDLAPGADLPSGRVLPRMPDDDDSGFAQG